VAFDRAIQLNPKNPEYWCGRGDAFFAQKQYRNALPSYESAIARNPGDTAALMGRARSQLALGLYAPAVESFDQVLRNDVNTVEAWLGKGIALKSLGKFRDADSAFDTVIRLDPGNVRAWEYKGATLSESGDLAGAIGAYNQVLLLDPKRDDIRRVRNELLTAQALQVTPVPENTAPLSDDSRPIQNPGLNLSGIDEGLWVACIIISGIVIGIVAVKRVRIRREPEPVFTIDTRLLKKEIDEFRSTLPEMKILPDPLPAPEVPSAAMGATISQRQPCEHCGTPDGVPAVCSYCKRVFCPDHLTPPDHNCSYLRDWERARSVPASVDGPEKDSSSHEK
ncbi:MAG: tetratricopeptide repeat protein, partial [Methanomicrobiales archaeon]|nr:tetratricopeptide repeat protein [Methanomicrobiales archaeon]